MKVLDIRNLSVEYRSAAVPFRAVSNVGFALEAGERFGLVGESGSGKSTIVLALMRTSLDSDPRWVAGPPEVGDRVEARIRYHAPLAAAAVERLDGDALDLAFDRPVRAVAPGQAVVLYRGDEVIGGGTIEMSLP